MYIFLLVPMIIWGLWSFKRPSPLLSVLFLPRGLFGLSAISFLWFAFESKVRINVPVFYGLIILTSLPFLGIFAFGIYKGEFNLVTMFFLVMFSAGPLSIVTYKEIHNSKS